MSRRDYIDDSDERISAFDNETDRLEEDDLCGTCDKKRKDHYTGPLGRLRCIDDHGIFYGTLRFRLKETL